MQIFLCSKSSKQLLLHLAAEILVYFLIDKPLEEMQSYNMQQNYFTIDWENKVFREKTIFTQYLWTNQTLQGIIKGKLQYKEGNHMLAKARY